MLYIVTNLIQGHLYTKAFGIWFTQDDGVGYHMWCDRDRQDYSGVLGSDWRPGALQKWYQSHDRPEYRTKCYTRESPLECCAWEPPLEHVRLVNRKRQRQRQFLTLRMLCLKVGEYVTPPLPKGTESLVEKKEMFSAIYSHQSHTMPPTYVSFWHVI